MIFPAMTAFRGTRYIGYQESAWCAEEKMTGIIT